VLVVAAGALLPISARLAVLPPGSDPPLAATVLLLPSGAVLAALPPERSVLVVAALVVAGQVLPLLARRRRPVAVLGAAVVTAVVLAALLRPDTVGPETVAVAVAAVAVHRPLRVSAAAAAAATVVVAALAAGADRRGETAPLTYVVVVLALAWCAGATVRGLRERRARRHAQEWEQAARAAVVDERSRIARELHDVVAQHVAGIAVQAGVARRVGRAQPRFVGEALETIRTSAVETATALDHLLRVLQPHGDDATQPGLADVEPLVRRHRDRGLPVRLQVRGRPAPASAELQLNAFRIVQEALTNTVKHAGPVDTLVEVRHGDGELVVAVTDRGRPRPGGPPGHGLLGMRERVALFGGSLRAGPTADGGWAVAATFPLDDRSAPLDGPRPSPSPDRATIRPWKDPSALHTEP
jgi:signal transduction histidine kinase